MRLFSFGGGVQSVAVLAMQAANRLARPYDVFVFANVGDDSENPGTLDYVRSYAEPYARAHGIPFVTVQKTRRGVPDTVYESVMRDNRSIPIPAFLASRAPGNRTCTTDFKILTVNRWARLQGATHVVNGVGISLDEYRRARFSHAWESLKKAGVMVMRDYPLIDARMTRQMCRDAITAAGLPIPPKSACWFCPFQSSASWIALRRDNPVLWRRALALEKRMNEKRGDLGRDCMTLHHSGLPLESAVAQQPRLFDDDACESGYCMT